MELNHLKYFYTVAKEGSFTRAARRMRVQQPTISKMVRGVEETLGLLLMERHKNGVRLTREGAEIFRLCEGIFGHVAEIQSFSSQERVECSGPLSFAATDSVASYLMPSIVAGFLRQYPKVRPSIFAGSSNLVCAEILENKVEFGIIFTPPDGDGFQSHDLLSVPFQLVVATAHLERKELRKSFVISREIDYPKRKAFPVLEMLRKNRITVETTVSCNHLDSQKQLVKQGLGVALLPRFMVKPSLQSGSLTAIQVQKDFSWPLKLVTRKGKVLSRNATTFLESFKQSVISMI